MNNNNKSAVSGRFSILLVEDNPGDRRLAEFALMQGAEAEEASCELSPVGSLGEAKRLLEDNDRAFDIVLLDLGLPDAKGIETLGGLRDTDPDIPVVILTGESDDLLAGEALKHGASDYVEKSELGARSLWRAVRYAIERKRHEHELMRLAKTDALTGVRNRRAFFDILERSLENARRTDLCFAVLMIDINGFKQVNDILGHSAGDDLLKTIADLLTTQLRRTDTVARLGGDEFAVIATNLKSPNSALEIAEKIRRSVREIGTLKDSSLRPSASIGIAVYPADDSPADVLVSHADMAMYRSKRDPAGAAYYYDEAMHREAVHRHKIKTNMISDIKGGKFYLDYQPIVDATTHGIVGLEGLARWKDADDKIIAPSEFIPIAEECGWISTLGAWLIDEACKFILEMEEASLPAIPISINVSPVQCREPGFALEVTSTILRHGVDPALINIEITESAIMQDIETASRSLRLLKDAGLGVHIDDFGTGYSSLSHLKDLPLNHLKVDRSFVSEMMNEIGSRRIVAAVAGLAKTLDFKTVAEGVESAEQAQALADLGIDYLQGYYFSRPVSVAHLKHCLANGGCINSGKSARILSLSDRRASRAAAESNG